MQNEYNALIGKKSEQKIRTQLIYHSINKHVLTLIGLIGSMQHLMMTYASALFCKEEELEACNAKIRPITFYISLGLGASQIILNELEIQKKNFFLKKKIKYVNKKINQSINILGLQTFYLICLANFVTLIYEHSEDAPQALFWLGIVLPSASLAMISDHELRSDFFNGVASGWRKIGGGFQDFCFSRNRVIKGFDALTSFLGSGASLISLIGTIEAIHDVLFQAFTKSKSWGSSNIGMSARYVPAVLYGIYQGSIAWQYSPLDQEEQKDEKNIWSAIMKSMFDCFAFILLTSFSISKEKNIDIALSSIFCLLLLLHSAMRARDQYHEKCQYIKIKEDELDEFKADEENAPLFKRRFDLAPEKSNVFDHAKSQRLFQNQDQTKKPRVEKKVSHAGSDPIQKTLKFTWGDFFHIDIAKHVVSFFQPAAHNMRTIQTLACVNKGFNYLCQENVKQRNEK